MKNWVKSGSPWIWLTAGSVAVSLLALIGIFVAAGRTRDALFLAEPGLSVRAESERRRAGDGDRRAVPAAKHFAPPAGGSGRDAAGRGAKRRTLFDQGRQPRARGAGFPHAAGQRHPQPKHAARPAGAGARQPRYRLRLSGGAAGGWATADRPQSGAGVAAAAAANRRAPRRARHSIPRYGAHQSAV